MSSPSKSPTMEPVQESHPHLKASVSQVSTSSGSPSPKQLQEQTEHETSFTRTKDAIVAPSVSTVVDHRFSEEEEQLNNFNNNLKRQQDAFLKSFPPGYRFNPRDDELVQHYLLKKILNKPLPPNKIMEVNLYRHNPETLAENYETYGEKEWYFFTPRDRKYRNGRRPNRAAGDGYWKATGADKFIWSGRVKIGCRKALVFYRGKPPKGKKTSWIMHEYRVPESHTTKRTENDMRLDNWVLCRIYKKAANKNNKTQRLNHESDLTEESISTSLPNDMEIEIEMNGQVDDTQTLQSEGEHPYNIVHQAYEFDSGCHNYAYTYPPYSDGRPMLAALNNNMLYHHRFQPIPLSSTESYANMLQMQHACGTTSPVYPDQNFSVQFSNRNSCVQFSDQKCNVHPTDIPPESILCTEEAPDQKCVVQITDPKLVMQLVNDSTSGSTICTDEACCEQKYDMQFPGQDFIVQPHDGQPHSMIDQATDAPPSMPCDQKSIQQEIGKPLLLTPSSLYIEETEVDRTVFYDPTFSPLGSFWP